MVHGPRPLDWSTDRGSVFSGHPFLNGLHKYTGVISEGCHTKRVSAPEQFPRFVAELVISVLCKDLTWNLASNVSMASIILCGIFPLNFEKQNHFSHS